MGNIDKYDVFMKQLEIIELDVVYADESGGISEDRKQTIINVIERIEGNLIQQQNTGDETNMKVGDTFENINQSVIATRGSIAKGIIRVREVSGDEMAKAIQALEEAIAGLKTTEISEDGKQASLELIDEITKQAASHNKGKVVLKQLGNGLWETIKNVQSLATVVSYSWPIIQGLWK